MAKFGANILITGANRGIGLAFVRYLAKENEVKRIFAGARNPQNAQDLQELEKLYPGKISSVQLDVQNDSSIESAYNHVKNVLKDEGLNLLINNAGILEWTGSSYENADRATFLRTFDVNTVSSVVVTKAFLPLLSKAVQKKERSVIVNISSGLASIKTTAGPYNRGGGIEPNVVYGMSKAAMNYFNRAFGVVEAKNGIISVAVAPGWIQTDMGGSNASLTVDESIPEILKTVGNLKIEDSGRFVDRFGQDVEY
uniref:NAD(P)-binding protein n=1 Tax=Acrobeloides nanus TaxID=290746 RepID=A0A914DJQ1_9BILA